jgi:putative DNA primase/helicase
MRICLSVEPDIELALSFLSFVFASALEGGYVNLFGIERGSGQRRTAWAPVEDLSKLAEPLWRLGTRGDVWFGCALRKEPLPNGQRGGVVDCLSITGLWLDVDVAGAGHRLAGQAKSFDEARLFINRHPAKPDAIVRSGHGFQAWWLAVEPLYANEALDYLARWRVTWLAYAKEAGIVIDDVWDLPRIMRVPGTYNHKGSEPVKVTARWKGHG